jgi:hypothetical protein
MTEEGRKRLQTCDFLVDNSWSSALDVFKLQSE